MRIGAAVLLVTTLLAGPVQAETAADVARCNELLLPLLPLLSKRTTPVLAEAGPDRCTFRGARAEFGQRFGFAIGTLVLKGPPLAAAEASGPLLQRRVELHDVTSAVDSGNPDVDWMLGQQQVPVDVVFDVSEDHTAHTLTVNEVSVQGDDVGRVSLDATLERVGADDPATGIPDLSEAGVRSVHLRADSKRFFVKYVLPALIGTWHGDDPAADMAHTKLDATNSARGMLQLAHSAPGSIEAVLAFLADLPKPRHVLDMSVVAAASPVTADDADDASTSMMGFATLLSNLRVTATYDRDAH